ncbi:J domain-containing protein [Rhodoferax lacus]|nr:J domain-containing protein [Rhodoferax lacus]
MDLQTNLYEVLEVSPRASAMVIRAAYRYLAQFHHPDKRSGASEAGHRLMLINQAYAVLSDPEQRRLYDHALQAQYPALERRGSGVPFGPQERPDGGIQVSRKFAFRPLD